MVRLAHITTILRRGAQHDTAPGRRWWPRWTRLFLPLSIALLIILPLGVLAVELLTPNFDLWARLWETILPPMLVNTVTLMISVGVGTVVIGAGFAWLVTAYQFPGRGLFDRALLLPLAVPAYIMGFIFMATFDFAGPVQTALRGMFGRGIVFPNIRSAWGVTLVMILVLYPYVYILARAAFREQAANTFEAARVMGYSRLKAFWRLVLPLARPSLAAGAILAMMEAMTDYGTVRFFGFPTLSEGVVRVWEGRMDRASAIELASLLLVFALVMIGLDRLLRGQARYYQQGGKGRRPERVPLRGWRGGLASAACIGLLLAAFGLPLLQLIVWTIREINQPSVGAWQEVYGTYILNSLTLAGGAAALSIGLALIVAYGTRRSSLTGEQRLARWITRLATLGYAMPGAVVAVGVLLVLAPLDHAINDFTTDVLGITAPGLIFTGSIAGLLYAYAVRFMAVGFNSVESSLEKITPNMEHAARTMGADTGRVLRRVYVPLVSSGMAAGALLVFVDVMKELPATLLLRPFGMDTLALWTYFLAGESFWQAAAIPSLTILVIGLIPVLLLMRVGDRDEHH